MNEPIPNYTVHEKSSNVIINPDLFLKKSIEVATLDPLGVDNLFQSGEFQLMNEYAKDGNFSPFIEAINYFLPTVSDIHAFSEQDAYAASRDLGMLLAGIGRHRLNPMEIFSDLEAPLLALYEKTKTSPYLTVFGYTIANREGEFRRTFTKTHQENFFIELLCSGMNSMLTGIPLLHELPNELNYITVHNYTTTFKELSLSLFPLRSIMTNIKKEIGLEFFMENIQPCFPHLTVNKYIFDAASGAQMPIILIDLLLHLSNTKEDRYSEYMNKNMISMPFELQQYAKSCIGRTPILRKIENAVSNCTNGISKEQKISLLGEVQECLLTLAIFRRAHQGITKKSMEKRDKDQYGSAGYGPQDLQYIIGLQDPQLTSVTQSLRKLNS